MNEYLFCIDEGKAVSKCRLCRRQIYPKDIRVKIIISGYTGTSSMCLHSDCALKYMVGEIKHIKIANLKKETDKLKKIEGLL